MMMPSSMCAFLELLATWLTRDAHGQRVPGLWERVPYADVQIVKKVVSARNKITLRTLSSAIQYGFRVRSF